MREQQEKDRMSTESFTRLLQNTGWRTIDQMVGVLDASDFWDDQFLEKSQAHIKKAYCRKMVRSIRSGDGSHKEFASIVTTDSAGRKVRIYKQETLFNVNDYLQCVTYWKGQGLYAIEEANGYARRCRTATGKQIPLPFPTFADH